MAVCKVCNREMLEASGCNIEKVHIGGNEYLRIPVGGDGDFLEDGDEKSRCHGCNALFSHQHHWGCDAERCPACGGQMISCDCEDVFVVT